jgi:DNA end-binding protein Ku
MNPAPAGRPQAVSLVSCAIALYPATTETTRVRFNKINRKSGNRVKRQFIDPETEDIVDTANQVKGYAVDKFITVEDEELDAIKTESTRTTDIDGFVPGKKSITVISTPPITSHPRIKFRRKPLKLFGTPCRTRRSSGRVVLARRGRPIMLEPYRKGIRAMTLRYAPEVRDAAVYFEDIPDIKLPAEMKELAEMIIDRSPRQPRWLRVHRGLYGPAKLSIMTTSPCRSARESACSTRRGMPRHP